MSSSARQEFRYVAEVTEGTTPATDMTIMHHSTVGMTFNPETIVDPTVRGDFLPEGIIRKSSGQPTLNVAAPLRYGDQDDPLAMLARSTWGAAVAISAQTDVAAATGGGTGGKFTSITADKFNSFAAGDLVRWSGFTGANSAGGWAVVSAVVTGGSPELQVSSTFGTSLSVEAAGDPVTIKHSGVLSPGTTLKFATAELAMQDITHFYAITGLQWTQWDYAMDFGSGITTGSFQGSGILIDRAGATFGTGTETAASTNSVFKVDAGFLAMSIGGNMTLANVDLQNVGVSITAPVRARQGAGSAAPDSQLGNNFGVTWTASGYNAGDWGAIIDAAHDDNTDEWGVIHGDGTNAIGIWSPEVKYTAGGTDGSGIDGDVNASVGGTAGTDSTYQKPVFITRILAY